MKNKVNYVEYGSLEELFKTSTTHISRVKYNGEYVYYVVFASYSGDTYFHFFLSENKYCGYLTTDDKGCMVIEDKMKSGHMYIPIIEVKNTNFIGGWILEYKEKNI